MKTKSLWISISVLLILGLLLGSFGCKAPAATTTTVTVTATQTGVGPTARPRAEPAPAYPGHTAGYYPVKLEGKLIEYIAYFLAHPVCQNFVQGMKDENEKWGFNIRVYDCALSPELASDLVDASIARKADAIVVHSADAPSGGALVKKVQDAGIPCLSFLNLTDRLADFSSMVDHYQNAAASTELLAKALNYKGKVGVVMGDKVHPTAIDRIKGFEDTIAKYPDMEIVFNVDCPTAPWSRDGAYAAMAVQLPVHPDLNGVFAGDDEMAVGVALAIEEAGKTGKIVLVGLGGEKSGLAAIREGRMYGTALYSPYDMGKKIIIAAGTIFSSPGYVPGDLQGIYWTDIIPVTKDNIDEIPSTLLPRY